MIAIERAMVLAALLAVASHAAANAGPDWRGRVVGVKDGDTISVMHDGRAETIRIASIDTPEKSRAFGSTAKQFTSALVFDRDVVVRPQTRDRYGRTVAALTLPDGRDLGEELVRAGLAWLYRKYSSDPTLVRLESEACAARRGLWADIKPTPPWEFRRPARESGRARSCSRPADRSFFRGTAVDRFEASAAPTADSRTLSTDALSPRTDVR